LAHTGKWKEKWASQAAKKRDPEGGGGFNPRIKPTESTMALAAEERFTPIPPEIRVFPQPVKLTPIPGRLQHD
jgi:hypothetical protein